MGLGRPYVLLPAVGALVIGGGPVTVGILTASAAIGTFLTSLFSGPVGHVRRHGVAIGGAVMVYGGFVAAVRRRSSAVMQTGWFGTVGRGHRAGQSGRPGARRRRACRDGRGGRGERDLPLDHDAHRAVPTRCAAACRASSRSSSPAGPASATSTWACSRRSSRCGSRRCSAACVIVAAVGVILRVQRSLRAYDALAPTP